MAVDDEELEMKPQPSRKVEVEEDEYVSDPDEQLRPCAMRRRKASDDESDGERGEEGERRRLDRALDGESDDQGGAPAYEDEEEDYEEYGDAFEEQQLEYGEVRLAEPAVVLMQERRVDGGMANLDEGGAEDKNQEQGEEEGEKKEVEPFSVPTAGAFYMHDDRFRESRGGGGRHRRTRGGRNLWESKDELAWVHDRFEETSVQDRHYNEQRRSGRRGRYRGRGRTRGTGRAYGRENKSQGFDDRSGIYNERPQAHDDRSQSYNDRSQPNDDRFEDYGERNSQYRVSKAVRGRGPRRYEPLSNNINDREDFPANRTKQNQKSHDFAGKQVSRPLNLQEEPVIPRKQVINSSLNSASPPFYPSGTSGQDPSMIPNRDVQTGSVSRGAPSLSNSSLRGKEAVEYHTNQDHRIHGKPTTNVHVSGSSSSSMGTIHSPQFRGQEKGSSLSGGQLNYRQNSLPSQSGRVSSQAPAQPSLRPSAPLLGQYPTGGGSASPIFQVQSANVSDAAESDSPTGSSKSKTLVSDKEKPISLSGNRGAILYNGAQFIGANGTLALGHGDQNFPGTPALLPVMQFPGQPNDGVPAVGMALPGYVAQPQMGFGGSEMAWLPMLAGANGALGSSYAPFITLDGGYHARQTVQTSSSSTTKEMGTTSKPDNTKSSQRSDRENEELRQRQNKPRRYSEMSFGQ